MIKSYMQVDLTNDLACRYMDYALKSFERVKDIFEIEVVQCITPDTLLPELKDNPNITIDPDTGKPLRNRSPCEIASLHSNYRMIKRMSEGEQFFVLEHDAYLRPDHEDVFRMVMSKWKEMPIILLGTAFEFYTMAPNIAEHWCDVFLRGTHLGPMGIAHQVGTNNVPGRFNNCYFPCNRYKDPRWCNMTGVGRTTKQCYDDPEVILNSPITQIADERYGGTVTDRDWQLVDGKYVMEKTYNRIKHPDFEWITLDEV